MLSIQEVKKDFGETVAVDSACLDLSAGERMSLLGANGSGKTTMLKMIVGLIYPSQGSIRLFGQDPCEVPHIRRNVGYLSDKPFTYDKLSCREHFRLHAALYELSLEKTISKGRALLSDMGMDQALDQRAETFSFGMQKKLALALALVHSPDLLIMDEPLTGLDPGSANTMETLLTQYITEGQKAIILSSHSIEFASRFSTRLGVMNQGKLSLYAMEKEDDAEWVRSLLST